MDLDLYDTPDGERLHLSALARWTGRAPRLLVTEAIAAAIVLLAALALATLGPLGQVSPVGAGLAIALYVVAVQITFPVGVAETAPTQLAFVPMLVVLPPALLPLIVIGCRLLPLLVPGLRSGGRPSPAAILSRVGDCAYALGPASVLVIAGVHGFTWAQWPIYTLALAAQFAVDLLFGLGRSWFADRTPPRELMAVVAWLYLVDIALSCVGLFVDASLRGRPALLLLVVPIIGLLALFARERRQRVAGSLTLSSTYRETAELLGDVLEEDDAYTGVHSREVAELALSVAVRLELDPLALFNVRYGALLHDVGKISVPKAILQKVGKLSPEEWVIMREHTVRGQEMLDRVGGSLAAVGRVVRHSHEHYDGSGYPDGLRGEAIPIEARIVAVADAWSAMTSSRPYRRALSVEVAADELKRCAGTQFDPAVVTALLLEVAPVYAPRPERRTASAGADPCECPPELGFA
jgi:putative nucleotidyltransferase with HDIG domain